jgi:hypothetical protein
LLPVQADPINLIDDSSHLDSCQCPIHLEVIKHLPPILTTVRRAPVRPKSNGGPTGTELGDLKCDDQLVLVLGSWFVAAAGWTYAMTEAARCSNLQRASRQTLPPGLRPCQLEQKVFPQRSTPGWRDSYIRRTTVPLLRSDLLAAIRHVTPTNRHKKTPWLVVDAQQRLLNHRTGWLDCAHSIIPTKIIDCRFSQMCNHAIHPPESGAEVSRSRFLRLWSLDDPDIFRKWHGGKPLLLCRRPELCATRMSIWG